MSIILHTGVPGSGKSYYMVHEMLMGDVQKKYFVLHNIDGLKMEYFDSKDFRDWTTLTSEDDFKTFFTKDNMKRLSDEVKTTYNKNLLIVIDECQNWLDKSDPEVKKFLSWHRHEDIDIWLCCQGEAMIARDYRALVEYTIQGNKSAVIDFFIYSFKVKRTKFRTRRLKKNEAVFQAYKSFAAGSAEKQKSKMMLVGVALGVVALVSMVYGIFFGIPKSFAKLNEKTGVKSANVKKEVLPPKKDPVPVPDKKGAAGPPPPPSGSGVDWSKFSLAVVIGESVSVQDRTGHFRKVADLAPGAQVMGYDGRCVRLLVPENGKVEMVCRQNGLVKPSDKGAAGGGGQGGWSLSSPTASSD